MLAMHRVGSVVRRRSRSLRSRAGMLLACLAMAVGLNGAVPAKKVPVKKRPEPAWINARSAVVLPLSGNDIPRTGGQLSQSLLGGWKGRLTFPDPTQVVQFAGGRYPFVESMVIDLSHAAINPASKAASIGDPVPTVKAIAAEQFLLTAEPMVQGKAKVNLRVTATDVRFDLEHDKEGKPILMLVKAKDGSLHFDVTREDLERIMLINAKAQGTKNAVTIRDVKLDLESTGPRSLKADLYCSTLVGFIPAGIRFQARVDIDEQMNAKISGLRCDGDELLGPLIVGLIRPSLAKVEGKSRPLLSFPGDSLHLRDLKVHAGEIVQLDANFGS